MKNLVTLCAFSLLTITALFGQAAPPSAGGGGGGGATPSGTAPGANGGGADNRRLDHGPSRTLVVINPNHNTTSPIKLNEQNLYVQRFGFIQGGIKHLY